MKTWLYASLAASILGAATQAGAQVTLYEGERFDGRSVSVDRRARDFERQGFANGLSSAVVLGERWEVCDAPRLRGQCMVLRQGRYPSPAAMGLSDQVASARPVAANERIDAARLAPEPTAFYDSRRRRNERLYDVPVTSVRAVMGPPGQPRCWIERETVSQPRQSNVPGAVVGAVIGGILGHQVGGGSGRDIATVGGAVAGGVVGSRVGTHSDGSQTRDVQRCASAPASTQPDHWDVGYSFRGQDHVIQTATPPGTTVTVNRQGEPRSR